MSIHVFHSKLSSRNENSALFEALRRLSKVRDLRNVMLAEETLAGWYPWNDQSQRNALTEA